MKKKYFLIIGLVLDVIKRYLLFLRPEEGVYAGFNACGGKYLLGERVSTTKVREIVKSGDESRWQEFLQSLSPARPPASGSPGREF